MEILKNVVLALHIIGVASLLGGILVQISAIKLGKTRILPAILHGAWTMLITGVILVGLQYPLGHEVNNVKITVKLVILAAILVVALVNRKRETLAGWVLPVLGGTGLVSLVGAYFVFPHVASRVDRFLDPAAGDNYQTTTALEAFLNGGLFGVGPGEGTVKTVLPDAHTDTILAVAGEEFGLIACLILVALFAFIVLRGFARALQESNLFILLAVAGLMAQFGLQALINLCSTLNLIPTKGMTLPFISYGGSSMLAMGLTLVMALALTRRRPGAYGAPEGLARAGAALDG